MQALVFLGGSIHATALSTLLIERLKNQAEGPLRCFAADQGAATALEFHIVPDLLLGDFDSLDPEIPAQLERMGSVVKQFPERKNATDGELVIDEVLASGCSTALLFTALGPERPDHMLMNIELLLRLKRAGIDAALSDGYSLLVALYGNEKKTLHFSDEFFYCPYVSFMSYGQSLENLHYEGLSYPIKQTVLRGSSIGISNYPAYFDQVSKAEFEEKKNEGWSFAFSMTAGEGLLTITPQD